MVIAEDYSAETTRKISFVASQAAMSSIRLKLSMMLEGSLIFYWLWKWR